MQHAPPPQRESETRRLVTVIAWNNNNSTSLQPRTSKESFLDEGHGHLPAHCLVLDYWNPPT